jgi:GH24 family phage-related lysozyme (muramidase)
MTPTLAELSSALLAVFEGPARLRSYQDGGGIWTIGRGHTKGVVEGMVITQAQSDDYFASDQAPLLAMPAGKPLLAAACYVSFGYNCGQRALRLVLSGVDTVTNPKYTHDARGMVEPGLVSRRALEALLIAVATPAADAGK